MRRIFVPSTCADFWKCLLAEPKRQWAKGYSARTLANCWEEANGFPREIQLVLAQNSILARSEPLLIFPEWKVSLPGRGKQSQNDIWILART